VALAVGGIGAREQRGLMGFVGVVAGRITELGMHVTVDATIRYGVKIGIAAACA
jgi:hypothetical protein